MPPPLTLPKQKEGEIYAYTNNANDLKQCSKATKPFFILQDILILSLKDHKNTFKRTVQRKIRKWGSGYDNEKILNFLLNEVYNL